MGRWDFLPGELRIEAGCRGDYLELERFHYCGGRPATWAGIVVARYGESRQVAVGGRQERKLRTEDCGPRTVGVGVLSWPVPCMRGRESHFGLRGLSYGKRIEFANKNVRTISRVIVHAQFRGVGLAVELVRWMLLHCDTRYVEAVAAMGKVHPFFEKAGMRRVKHEDVKHEEGRAYFIWERPKFVI